MLLFVSHILFILNILLSKMIEKSEFLISKLPNMFLSEMSFLDSVERVPKKLFHTCKVS